ncbi:ComEA family DNA-binding protein [Ferrovum myxofaciens]|uniref:ComE operon protein 1 n=2 Tax=root TaxID=1 RepID=A0A8F3DUM8_9PROT|nr:helix-hairpin-helix domain-containing protein [Ferrovum myxofaciens]KXW58973.1 ComE operon protein 1 [Ferrovum myxofaciens]MBU6993859.1 helix-hairpin-helix domain-containing protein [Ferrovum myxofaciens]QKE39676.2 MAG: helix-hairpin-helix domain-containing protein [Ferrovum myxofaciens]QWY75422.1 MAG: helix-hairpin-helix domain-containing protein [Ferrovum myxofaciens]QWY78162.1 MAG: helix-hairpin-helix domain-containing protein [Ferrovum myxofaciens]
MRPKKQTHRLLLTLFCVFFLWTGGGKNAWALVDLNSANEVQLRTVKGIGHTRAQAILTWRAHNGVFHSAADLRKVKGFGEKTIAKVGPHLSIQGQPLMMAPKHGPMATHP